MSPELLAAAVATLPTQLAKSLAWDLGHEMAAHQRFTSTSGIEVCFSAEVEWTFSF